MIVARISCANEMLDKAIFCRDISLQSSEMLAGTVGTRRAWLLLQDHAAWAIQAYAGSAVPPHVRDHLAHFFGQEKSSILLIRNSDAKLLPVRKAFVIISRNARAEIYGFDWIEYEDLLELPYAEILAGTYAGPQTGPIYLVCTHGKRDKCCAKYGMPVYQHLRQRLGERVWRASHVGGDRFAANLVCMPHGLYYGRVTPQQALELVQLYEKGELAPEHMRGRSCYPKLTQAAEIFARREVGIHRIDRLQFHSHHARGDRGHCIRFQDRETQMLLEVDIEETQSTVANFLTCRAEETEHFPIYRALAVRQIAIDQEPHVLPA